MTAINSTSGNAIGGSGLKSVRRSVGLESVGFGVAEMASMGVSLGVVAVADKLIPEAAMKAVSKTISKVVIEPYLETIEKFMDKCKIEECKVDRTKPPEERAESYAKTLSIFSTAFVASILAKLIIRRKMNDVLGVGGEGHSKLAKSEPLYKKILHDMNVKNWSRQERTIIAVDEGVHIGSLIYLNTMGADITDAHIKSTTKFLEKFGISEKKARDISTMLHVWEVPNVAGMLAGFGTIFSKHAYGFAGTEKCKYQKFTDILKGDAKTLSPSNSIT